MLLCVPARKVLFCSPCITPCLCGVATTLVLWWFPGILLVFADASLALSAAFLVVHGHRLLPQGGVRPGAM
jgi:hypothetical protein